MSSSPSDQPVAEAHTVNEPSSARPLHPWLKRIGTAVSLCVILFSALILYRTISAINWHDVSLTYSATGWDQIAYAAILTACSYLALTGYDVIALRQLALKVPYSRAALASFTSYAISFTLGFPIITAGTVRFWIYSQERISAGRVASLTVIAGVTFWLGMALVIAVALLLEPASIAEINHAKIWVNQLIGMSLLVAIAVYLLWVSLDHRWMRIQGLKLELPGFGLTLGQLFLGVMDLSCAAGTLYVLLPQGHKMDFATFLATYVFGCLLGIASNLPGGLGAFEVTMLQSISGPSQGAILASLLQFRVLYYFIPFISALALLGAHEIFCRWTSLRAAMSERDHENDDIIT